MEFVRAFFTCSANSARSQLAADFWRDLTATAATGGHRVCDRAHEEIADDDSWLQWSVPDPVPFGTEVASGVALSERRQGIEPHRALESPDASTST